MDSSGSASLTFDDRRALGREARALTPRSSHGGWQPPAGRADPVLLLEEQADTRIAELIPIRYGRMMVSPFTFYRGAALLMAADLATTPNSGITVQLCGDAHLSNFGFFGTPERKMLFDINDFDETLPGPWEWDLKRLAASFEVAARYRGFREKDRNAITHTVGRAYREQMRTAASSRVLDAWYDHLDADEVLAWISEQVDANRATDSQLNRAAAGVAKARSRDNGSTIAKLVGRVDGRLRILANRPLIVPVEDLADASAALGGEQETIRRLLAEYEGTLLQEHHPVHEYSYVHMARKVVGVGSVGTRAWIVLLRGRDDEDLLLVQAKEAQASVLERFLAPSPYDNHGERIVRGQRMMQAASDIFLGWQRVPDLSGITHDFYLRQLRDWKGAVDIERMRGTGAMLYADLCGRTLARAHARSGDRVAIAAYLGSGVVMDDAIARFASDYADQNERDYAAFLQAIDTGRLSAIPGL
ncbi:uncharacterized protein (DUF2252 family) [Glaciihabitans tibetensis]|uniref:Uncharacterized protein (DUF2252 family) n=1 Tax=Glaciihabitans tibetensis TaxID=1266600 RepID=A0A2T0VFK1_9MICO|nr:DUF2252 domain-containing protein [Glaciihabitans tibetensis]PRY68988.1 uncharacterized protein (DUF2252 family) [Glaciihabitans tibetensis]